MHYSKIFPLTYLYLLLVTPASFFLVNSLITSLNELEWNDEERLAKNYVLYLESYCNIELGNFYIQEMPMSLHLLHQFHIFNKFQNENCIAIGLLKGTRKDHLIYPLYENIYDESIEYKEWMRNFHRKEIGWKSEHSHDLEIYFSDVEGGNILVANLHPGEQNTVWLDTYLGHIFRVLDPISDEIIDEILVEYDSYHTYFISFDQYELKNLNNEKDILDGVNDTLHHEFSRSLNVHRTFTPLGFDKATLPLDIYGSMMTYYNNNYNSIYIEDWMVITFFFLLIF